MSNNLDDLDDSEEWENIEIDDFIVPFKASNLNDVQKQEQLKQLEERKLVEEADTELSKELFCSDNAVLNKEPIIKPQIESEPKIKINKQKQNENKQKELSKKIKEQKIKQKRHNELYGEVKGDYMYDEYNDKFNK